MRDYKGKRVYIGIDVHKKTYAVTAISEGEIVKRDTILATPEELVQYINKFFPNAEVYTAYEAGFSGFYLHRCLIKNQINNIVVHPASIEVAARDRVKTDKRDSLKIAKQLTAGRLRGIHVPSEEREQHRAVTRTRDTLMTHRKRIGNQLKSLLFFHGLIRPDDDSKTSRKWIKQIQKLDVGEELKYCIDLYAEEWLRLETKLKEILKKLEGQAKKDEAIDLVYRAVPGIGALSARILSNELEMMDYFENEKQLFSYTGLTPSEYSSGEHRRQGHISRQGKPILRKLLIQIAWRAIEKEATLSAAFERISKKAGKKRAIVAIGRKLIGQIRSTFQTGEIYRVTAISH